MILQMVLLYFFGTGFSAPCYGINQAIGVYSGAYCYKAFSTGRGYIDSSNSCTSFNGNSVVSSSDYDDFLNEEFSTLYPRWILSNSSANDCQIVNSTGSIMQANCTSKYGFICQFELPFYECYAVNFTEQTVCSSHGKCIDEDECLCDTSWDSVSNCSVESSSDDDNDDNPQKGNEHWFKDPKIQVLLFVAGGVVILVVIILVIFVTGAIIFWVWERKKNSIQVVPESVRRRSVNEDLPEPIVTPTPGDSYGEFNF